MSATTTRTTKVTLRSPAPGPYRLQVLGDDPSKVISEVTVGRPAEWTVNLAPGRYLAVYDALGVARRASQVLVVKGKGPIAKRVEYGQIAPVPSAPASAAGRCGEGPWRRFAIGVSTDKRPRQRGGWEPAEPDIDNTFDPKTGILTLDISRCTGWREDAKRRLTIAVEGRPAWRIPLPLFQAGLKVQIAPKPPREDGASDFEVTVLPRDVSTQALVASLEPLDSEEAQELLSWSAKVAFKDIVRALINKRKDPWAATIAGLAVVRDHGPIRDPQWAYNLTEWFDWLTDGPVLAAAAVAMGDGRAAKVEAEALRLLVEADRRGAPYFKQTNALAVSLLTTLAMGGGSASIQRRAQTLRNKWAARGRPEADDSFLMRWDETKPILRKGKLPKATYDVRASGYLCGGEVRFSKRRPVKPKYDT